MDELRKKIEELRALGLSDDGIRQALSQDARARGIPEEVIVGLLKSPLDRLVTPEAQSSTAVSQPRPQNLGTAPASLRSLFTPAPEQPPTSAVADRIAQAPVRDVVAPRDAGPQPPALPQPQVPTIGAAAPRSLGDVSLDAQRNMVREGLESVPTPLRLLATAADDNFLTSAAQYGLSKIGLAPDPANSLIKKAEELGVTTAGEKAASITGLVGGIAGGVKLSQAGLGAISPALRYGQSVGQVATRAAGAEAVISGADFLSQLGDGVDAKEAALWATLFGLTGVGAEVGLALRPAARAARARQAAEEAARAQLGDLTEAAGGTMASAPNQPSTLIRAARAMGADPQLAGAAAGSITGGAAGAADAVVSGDDADSDEIAIGTIVGMAGGAFLGTLIGGSRARRPGFARIPKLVTRGPDGRVVVDPLAGAVDLGNALNDPKSFAATLHHVYGDPRKPVETTQEVLARQRIKAGANPRYAGAVEAPPVPRDPLTNEEILPGRAAFLHPDTGELIVTGTAHDLSKLDLGLESRLIDAVAENPNRYDGFVGPDGQFVPRDQAGAVFGALKNESSFVQQTPLARSVVADGETPITIKRGSAKLNKVEFTSRMELMFPDLAPKEIDKLYESSWKFYQTKIRETVNNLESMADWDDLLDLRNRGAEIGGAGWYTRVHETLMSLFGNERDAEMYARFLTANSPLTPATTVNIDMANRAFLSWKLDGISAANPRPNFLDGPHQQALQAAAGAARVFKGRKLENYYRALMGDPEAVVIDSWMGRALFGVDKVTDAQYEFAESMVRQIAQANGWTPMDTQANIWSGIKDLWISLGRSPKDLIEPYAETLTRRIGGDIDFLTAVRNMETPDGQKAARDLLNSLKKGAADPGEAAEAAIRLGNQAGFATPEIVSALARIGAGSMVGSVAGAAAADESPVAGAITGAVVGGAVGAAAGRSAREAAAKVASSLWRRGQTPDALAASDVAGILATRRFGPKGAVRKIPVHGPTSGFPTTFPIDTEEFIGDLAKLDLDTPTTEVVRALVQENVFTRGLPSKAQRRMTWEETRRMAKEIGFEDLPTDARRMTQDEAQATRDMISQTGRYITETLGRLMDPHLVPDEKIRLEFRLGQLETRMGDLLEMFNTTRSQFGRNLNILKQFAQETDNPILWYARAQRLMQEPMTLAIKAEIDRLLSTGDKDGLVRYIASLRRPTLQDKVLTVWKAGLLTAPTTHMANLLGNVSMASLEAAKDAPAVMYDMLIGSLVTGRRTKGSPLAGLRSLPEGARRGASGAYHAATEGVVDPNLYGKYELKFGEIDFKNPVLNVYTRTVFRGLLAGDQFFRGVALQRSLVDQAEAYAINAGLKGDLRQARIKELLLDPPLEMVFQAIHDAELATFINTPRVDLARDVQRSLGVAGHAVLPFAKTPSNIIERAFEYSPLGPLARAKGTKKEASELLKLFKSVMGDAKALDAEAQRRLVDTLGRSTVGSTAVTVGYILASHDKLTGAYPRGRDADKWKQEGRTENSVLVDGNWWRLDRLSPVGNLMVFGAALHDAMKDLSDGDSLLNYAVNAPEALLTGAVGGTQSLLKQSFLTNLNETLEVLTGDHRGSVAEGATRLAQSYAGSLVPTIIRKVASGIDQGVKERETVLDGVKAAALPGLLEDKLDTFGRPQRRAAGVTEQLLNPFNRSPDLRETDPVVDALSRLDIVVSRRQAMANESDADFRKRQKGEGRLIRAAIEQAINNAEFEKLDDELKKEVLEKVISGIRATSTRAYKIKYTIQAAQ